MARPQASRAERGSVLERLRYPIVLAPLAGGASTPALAAAVGAAGGLGFLAAGYRSADELAGALRDLRACSAAPFGVNLFVPGAGGPVDDAALRAYAERLASTETPRYGVAPGTPHDDDDAWAAKLELVCAEPPAVVSFTFGCPDAAVLTAVRAGGAEAWVTVAGPDEAVAAVAAGASALVVQGLEAGGHRGGLVDGGGEGLTLLVALRLVAAAVPGVPLVGAGGIADGASLAAALAAGAAAGQAGTAFLLAPEAGTHEAHRRALLAGGAPTAVTRAFSGRTARGIANRFLLEHGEAAPFAYPQVNQLTAPLRAAAREQGDADGLNLWAGQAYPLAVARPAGETVAALAAGAESALAAAARRLEQPEPPPNTRW